MFEILLGVFKLGYRLVESAEIACAKKTGFFVARSLLTLVLCCPAALAFNLTISDLSPSTASPDDIVTVTALNFVGTVNAPSVAVAMTPTSGGGPVLTPTVTSAYNTLGELTVTFRVPPVPAGVTPPAIYQISISGQNTASTTFTSNQSSFTLLSSSISVSPNSGLQGANGLVVDITGVATQFQNGVTMARFGADISVGGGAAGAFGPVTVLSPTAARATLNIAPGAVLGLRTISVQTGAQSPSLPNGFTVIGAPSVTLSPASGLQGQTLNVAITGTNTSFVQGTTTANFGVGVTVHSVSVASVTNAIANITIAGTATIGARTVPVSTGMETTAAIFSVLPADPAITSLLPNTGEQGQSLIVVITGQNLFLNEVTPAVSFGAGITVQSVTVNSPTQLTVSIHIATGAQPGPRTAVLTLGARSAAAPDAFTVIAADTPTITSVTPASGERGQRLSVRIVGANTNFTQGITQVSFGSDISVTNVVVESATSLLASLEIPEDAVLGGRDITVVTGSEIVAREDGFTVVASTGRQPLTCVANAGVPPLVRAEGLTELVGDIVFVCTGGIAGETRTVNLQLFLNTNITSRIISAGNETEALLLVDELGLIPTGSPATPAAHKGIRGEQGENVIVWPGVVIASPGSGQRVLRITNVRANAAGLGVSNTLIPTQITAFLSASPSQSLALSNPQQTVAYVQQGLQFDIRTCGGGVREGSSVNLAQCTSANNSGSWDLLNGATGDMQFALRFREGFQTAFRPQLVSGQSSSLPGAVYNSESGFVRQTGDLTYAVGGASQGTRLVARFTNVPPGARIFVTGQPSYGSTGSLIASLIQAGSNAEGAYLPIGGTATLTCPETSASGFPAAEVPIVNNIGMAVWEITAANAAVVEEAIFGVAVALAPNLPSNRNAPSLGVTNVSGNFGPFYAAASGADRMNAALPIPRFTNNVQPLAAFRVEPCVTNLLFPFVTNQAGFDTGVAISNTSRDPFAGSNSRLQSGTCTINYYGRTEQNGAAPPAQRSITEVQPGSTLAFVLSSGGSHGIVGTPGFQGYLIAQCDFRYAHGFAFLTDGAIGTARVAEGYLALVLDAAVTTRGSVSESVSH